MYTYIARGYFDRPWLKRILQLLARCSRGALAWFGIPCCSWIWVSRSSSRRSGWCPEGDSSNPWVTAHNKIAARCALLIEICGVLGLYVIVENPLCSLLFEYWAIRLALDRVGATRKSLRLSDFGAESVKPIELWGNVPWLDELSYFASPPSRPLKRLSTV